MLFRLIDWYLRRRGYIRVLRSTGEIARTAAELVGYWNRVVGISGEAKRHQVYARLIKLFPQAAKRDLALAIEHAVRDLDV